MNVVALFGHVPSAIVVGWVLSNLIPYLSAAATKFPGWWTGFVTQLLAVATGFFSTWAAQGDGFDWKTAAGAALVSWLVAVIHHDKVLKGTSLESRLQGLPSAVHYNPAHEKTIST